MMRQELKEAMGEAQQFIQEQAATIAELERQLAFSREDELAREKANSRLLEQSVT
jgi:uncharacterized protein (DUF2384 family)